MKFSFRFPTESFNMFVSYYFGQQRSYLRDDLIKADFYTSEKLLKSTPTLLAITDKVLDLLNSEGAQHLTQLVYLHDVARSFKFKGNPFGNEIKEFELKRSNEIVLMNPLIEATRNMNYLKELKPIEPVNGLVSIDMDLLRNIGSQTPNAVFFDILNTKGKPVKVKDIRVALDESGKQSKSVLDKIDPRTLETSGMLPIIPDAYSNLKVIAQSDLPVKVNKLELARIDFDHIASGEVQVFEYETPKVGIEILGYGVDDLFGKANYNLEATLIVEEQTHTFTNPRLIYFGSGFSKEDVFFVNLTTPVTTFEISFKLIKKPSIDARKLIDLSSAETVLIPTTKEQLKSGFQLNALIGDPVLLEEIQVPISRQTADTFTTATEFVLEDKYRSPEALGRLRIANSTQVQIQSTETSDTTFRLRDNVIVETTLTGPKYAWFENEYDLSLENQKLKVKSQLELTKLKLTNAEVARKTEDTFRYKDFRKHRKDVIRIPRTRNVEDIRLIKDKVVSLLVLTTEENVPVGSYKVVDNVFEIGIAEADQAFSQVVVYGDVLKWRTLEGDLEEGFWYFDYYPSSSSITATSNTSVAGYIVKESLQIPGYELLDHHNTRWISNLRLKVSSSTNGTSYFNIPYTPYALLECSSFETFGTATSYLYSTSTHTSCDVSFLSLPNTGTSKMFWVEGSDVKFLEQPSDSVTINYQYINGYFEGFPARSLPYTFSDNKISADLIRKTNYYVKYSKGETKDINVTHPRKVSIKILGV